MNFEAPNMDFGTPNSNFEASTMDFGTPNSNFEASNMDFGTSNSNFEASNMDFGTSNSNFEASNMDFGTPNSNFEASNSNFGTSNSNFGTSNSNFEASNSNFGTSNSNFEASNMDFGTSNSNSDALKSASGTPETGAGASSAAVRRSGATRTDAAAGPGGDPHRFQRRGYRRPNGGTPAMATIFDRILDGDVPAHRVLEDEHVLAFLDVGPLSEGHVLVIPKERVAHMHELSDDSAAALGRVLPRICRAVMEATGATAYNILQNNGADAHQAVMHVHLHVIPRFPDRAEGGGLGLEWHAGTIDAAEAESLRARLVSALEAYAA